MDNQGYQSIPVETAKLAIEAATPLLNHAKTWFDKLKWKPLPSVMLPAWYVSGYGNSDNHGNVCVCIIDPVARLFQVKLVQRSSREKLDSNCIVNWEDTKTAIDRFNHYMDVTGNFLKEAWLRG